MGPDGLVEKLPVERVDGFDRQPDLLVGESFGGQPRRRRLAEARPAVREIGARDEERWRGSFLDHGGERGAHGPAGLKIAEAENDGQYLNVWSQRKQKRELDLETVLTEMGDMVRLRLRAARQKRPGQVCRDRQRAARQQPFALIVDRDRWAQARVVGTDQNRGGG